MLFRSAILVVLALSACAPIPVVKEKYASSGQKKKILMIKKGSDSSAVVKEIEYYENGQVSLEVERKGIKRDGKYLEFYPDGIDRIVGKYADHMMHGKWQYYSKNGRLDSVRTYKNGLLHGQWQNYNNGLLITQKSYKKHKRDGKYLEFYPDGNDYFIGKYSDNLRDRKSVV